MSKVFRSMMAVIPALLAVGASLPARGEAPAATQPAGFEVHEWVVLLGSCFDHGVNQLSFFGRTIPTLMADKRPKAEPTQGPAPVGVITFRGAPTSGVLVTVGAPGGKFLGYWPPAQAAETKLTWADITLTPDPPPWSMLPSYPWVLTLKASGSLYAKLKTARERFLMYDLTCPYDSPISLRSTGAESWKLSTQGHTLGGLTLYQPTTKGWRVADVSGTGGAPPGAPVFGPVQPTGSAKILAPWSDKLARQGLDPTEVKAAMTVLCAHALDRQTTTAVYLLDKAELDRLIPLTVTPPPARTVRVAIVIARDIDPAIREQIDVLITQLGDPSWPRREEAQRQLEKTGEWARPRLRMALRSKDPEVVDRVEQALEVLDSRAPVKTDNQVAKEAAEGVNEAAQETTQSDDQEQADEK